MPNFGDMRFDVVKNTLFWDVMPYFLVECYRRFGMNLRLHLMADGQGEGTKLLVSRYENCYQLLGAIYSSRY